MTRWFVQRYWMVTKSTMLRTDYSASAGTFVIGTYFAGYVGMSFPKQLYPSPLDLPAYRAEIELFPEFNLQR